MLRSSSCRMPSNKVPFGSRAEPHSVHDHHCAGTLSARFPALRSFGLFRVAGDPSSQRYRLCSIQIHLATKTAVVPSSKAPRQIIHSVGIGPQLKHQQLTASQTNYGEGTTPPFDKTLIWKPREAVYAVYYVDGCSSHAESHADQNAEHLYCIQYQTPPAPHQPSIAIPYVSWVADAMHGGLQ